MSAKRLMGRESPTPFASRLLFRAMGVALTYELNLLFRRRAELKTRLADFTQGRALSN